MEKSFKDYAHLYLGCEVTIPNRYNFGGIITDLKIGIITGIKDEFVNISYIPGFHPIVNFKPIMRSLGSITSEEIENINWSPSPNGKRYDPSSVVYLLSKGFDLFGLIDAGIALDKTKI